MGKILRILVVAVALAASAGAKIRATDTLPSESLVVTASSLGQRALNDPAGLRFRGIADHRDRAASGRHRSPQAGGRMGRGQAESSGLRETCTPSHLPSPPGFAAPKARRSSV